MLELIRKYSKSIVVKIFLSVLAGSFLLFFGFSAIVEKLQGKDYVVKVGGIKIPPQVFKYEKDKRLRVIKDRFNASSEDADKEISKAILQQMIWENVISLGAEDFGVLVTDSTLFSCISNMSVFRTEEGRFDASKLRNYLKINQMSEKEFITSHIREIRANIMKSPYKYISYAEEFPHYLRISNELRKIKFIEIDPSKIKITETPTEEVLETYYNEHSDQFEVEEKRSFTVLMMPMDKIEAGIKIEEDEIIERAQSYYVDDYDEKTSLEKYKTTDDYKDLKKEKIAVAAGEVTREIEDELVGGSSVEEVAKKYNLKTLDVKGVTLADKDKVDLPFGADALTIAFGSDEGEVVNFNEGEDANKKNIQWLVYVTDIEAKRVEAFDKVKDKVKKEWLVSREHEKALEIANDIIAQTKQGKDLGGFNYKITESGYFDALGNVKEKSKFDEAREKIKKQEKEKNKERYQEKEDPYEEMYKRSMDKLLKEADVTEFNGKVVVYQVIDLKYKMEEAEKDKYRWYLIWNSQITDDMYQQLIGYLSKKYEVKVNYDQLKKVDDMIDVSDLENIF